MDAAGMGPPSLGEFALIERFFERPATQAHVRLGVGDDCALLDVLPGHCLAVSTDMLVEGRHFFPDVDPESLGHKALAVNVSDLAAMGAQPLGFTLALALPRVDPDWLAALTRGLWALADQCACPCLGGDTTAGPLNLTLTVLGAVPFEQALRRDAAQAGDDVWVSGALGGAAWLLAQARAAEGVVRPVRPVGNRLDWPQPRWALGVGLRGVAHAAIDLSDGLVGDLGHVLRRSSRRLGQTLGATLAWPAIPVDPALMDLPITRAAELALAGGDDYELLFTAAPAQRATLAELSHQLALPLTRIGVIETVPGLRVLDAAGHILPFEARSYDHFR